MNAAEQFARWLVDGFAYEWDELDAPGVRLRLRQVRAGEWAA